jgi:L-alanine-DL-glutamate epimerase-like enolase superfamily enzyme
MPHRRLQMVNLTTLDIPFAVAFRHASAERSSTSTLWATVTLDTGVVGHGESCPRDYVTGETFDTARLFVARHAPVLTEQVVGLASLRSWMTANTATIDANPAAWCAVELAMLDAFGKEAGRTVESLLCLPELEGLFRYTAVVGDASARAFEAAVNEYRQFGFSDFKVKLSGDLARDRSKMATLRALAGTSIRVRVDANNLWRDADEAITFLQALEYPFFAVEEPLAAGQYDDLEQVSVALGTPIVLDESLLRLHQLTSLPPPSSRWIINVRVSKMGGLLRSLALVESARRSGFAVVVGAQVGETSLLTRAALTVARSAGNALLAQEGAFGTRLLTRDVCDPPVMFGPGGILDVATFPILGRPGLGIVEAARVT